MIFFPPKKAFFSQGPFGLQRLLGFTLRMNKKIMKFTHLKYPNILKQRFSTFGTVITVADNEQYDVEIDSD